MGVVASRRARGDRIELWVGGKAKREPTPGDWIDRLKEVLADQVEMPEVRRLPTFYSSRFRERGEISLILRMILTDSVSSRLLQLRTSKYKKHF